MTGNIDEFCERCGKPALSPASVGAAGGGSGMLRRLRLGGRSSSPETADTSALRLCLGCRGYICSDCWNDEATVCQTCQPLAGVGVRVQPEMPEEETPPGLQIFDDAAPAESHSMPLAWPASDLYRGSELEALVDVEPDEPPAEFEFQKQVANTEAPEEAASPDAAHMPGVAEVADMAGTADMVAESAETADSFEDRWAEIIGRVQAWGTAAQAETRAGAAEAAVEESVVTEATPEVEPVAAGQPGDAAEEPLAASTEEAAFDEFGAADVDEPVAANADKLVAVDEQSAALAEDPVVVEPDATEPVGNDQVTEATAVTHEPAAEVVDDVIPAAAEPAAVVVDEPSVSGADTDEDVWAAVLHDADTAGESERSEPDSQEIARLLQPRRGRRRLPKPLPRRPVRLPTQPEPTTSAPTVNFATEPVAEPATVPAVERVTQPDPPLPPRSLKLPPALPPPAAATTQPWPMPAAPAFLPPPPPAAMTAIQPAPARFRPQSVPVEQPKPPTTQPCGNCGLELSAKVTFCRRCGIRQPLPA